MKSSPALPRGVWMLGFVSLFMDVSPELIHGLLPVFMVTSLGASVSIMTVVGNWRKIERNSAALSPPDPISCPGCKGD